MRSKKRLFASSRVRVFACSRVRVFASRWARADALNKSDPPKVKFEADAASLTPVPTKPVEPSEVAHWEEQARRHFGFPSLRAGQGEVIARVARGEDVLALMPTGGGKSVCYQLPALVSPGLTVVVSPLIALMKDQLDSLPHVGMRMMSAALTSELTSQEARDVMDKLRAGSLRLLYVAPERLRSPLLLRALREAHVKRLVVDEAHCVSVWGHDFRPDFLRIADARRMLGNPPILAVTATAPPRVRDDIQARLGPLVAVVNGVARPNLRFEAVHARDADEKLRHLEALCKKERGAGIVYVNSRAKAEQIATALAQKGVNAMPYHAGMPDRARVQDAFMRGDVNVLVATVAFGMGVDKGDIRFVFHHDPSASLENYYQEAGRAGRDGAPARCVVLATSQDAASLKTRAKRDLPSKDVLDATWRLLVTSLAEDRLALVDPDALRQVSPQDDVGPRVALSYLEESGAIERIGDVPGFLVVDGRERSLFEVAASLGVEPGEVEDALLAQGTSYRATTRATLYRVLGEPERVEEVWQRHAKLATARADEMMAYVRTRACRHAHLARHFGETDAPSACNACDNCLGIRHEAADADPEEEQLASRAVLHALAGLRGIGETNLVFLLRGDARTPGWAHESGAFGKLAFRSESKVRAAIRVVEEAELVRRETLPHGGVSLRITPKGLATLGSGAPLPVESPQPARTPATRAPRQTQPDDETPLDDEAQRRFEALRRWRRERADQDGVPPYVIAHDKTLRAIAAAAPTDAASLGAVKGMGPKRVENYGEEMLDVLRG